MTRSARSAEGYFLTQVHDLSLKEFTRIQNAVAWRKNLSTEDYVLREHILGLSTMITMEGHELMVFIMTAKHAPDVPLCSCELLVRNGYRYVQPNGKVERRSVKSGCIGAVFTPEKHRGRGLAQIMIDLLVAFAKSPKVLGEDGFIFMYSEVGEYYTRNGFKSVPVALVKCPFVSTGDEYIVPPNVELIKFHQFGEVFKAYQEQFNEEMCAKVAADGIERVSVAGNELYVDWFHLRAKYLGVKLFGTDLSSWDFANATLDFLAEKFSTTQPQYFGLKLTSADSARLRGFIVWTYDYDYDTEKKKFHNYVTVIKNFVANGNDKHATTVELFKHMKQYLEAHHDEPQLLNFEQLKIWESDVPDSFSEWLVTEYGAKKGINNPSRSALLLNRKEDDQKFKEGKLIWEENTKLPWF